MKYKVGDRVKIKSLDQYNENKDKDGYVDAGLIFDKDMSRWCGKTMTILKVYQTYYAMEEDYISQFYWTDEMIECKVEKIKPKFKVGDKVRVKSLDWYNENKDEFDQIKCGNQIFTYPMTKLCGKTVTITCVNTKDCYYVISGDDGYNSWTDEMIECKVEA